MFAEDEYGNIAKNGIPGWMRQGDFITTVCTHGIKLPGFWHREGISESEIELA
jgi:hypothetical protein